MSDICNAQSLRIISTGGTFEKTYDPLKGALGFSASHVPAIVDRARVTGPVAIEVALLIDSLDMNDEHRARLLTCCQAAAESRLVIIHGTDTMVESAQVLGRAALDKTIVFTGAMVPYEVAQSDSLFNLGFAMAVARLQPPGVYVAMNAQVFAWDKVQKNRQLGRFESL